MVACLRPGLQTGPWQSFVCVCVCVCVYVCVRVCMWSVHCCGGLCIVVVVYVLLYKNFPDRVGYLLITSTRRYLTARNCAAGKIKRVNVLIKPYRLMIVVGRLRLMRDF